MRFLLVLFALSGCATREPARASGSNCPEASAFSKQVDQLGSATVQVPERDACRIVEHCEDGAYACRCDAARGGAPRPNRWLCHRARQKPDGCPDDDVLLSGGACPVEGKRCRAPVVCGCNDFTEALCQSGQWTLGECGRCLAP